MFREVDEFGFGQARLVCEFRLTGALEEFYCPIVGGFHTLGYDMPGKCTELYRDFNDCFGTTGRLNHVDPAFVPV